LAQGTNSTGTDLKDIEVDVQALNRKYAEERAKRLRGDAVGQYQELAGKFAAFDRDPNADPNFARAPLVEDVDVLVIGGGFAGLLAGGRLREKGVQSLRIVEKGSDFGGTWYWNRYPGAACDVESYIYLPMLEEMGYTPTEKYVRGPEIYEYCQRLAQRYDLYRGALFQTEVHVIRWDDERRRWLISTDRNDAISARFVISCTGLQTKPKLPGIPGIDSFQGHAFHTSRWDYDYTGGDANGNMTGLADKAVGIIGTGATGIQVTPRLAESAKHLYVFQRTPSSVDPRGNKPTDPEWSQTLKPGWQSERMLNFTTITGGGVTNIDLVNDGWTEIIRSTAPPAIGDTMVAPAELELAQLKKMEQTRRRISAIVADPATAEALKPYYHYFCKRPCFHDEYLPTFNRPNVTLVDTKGKGVERVTPRGVMVAGREYPLDCLIFATGFDWLGEYTAEFGIEIIGPRGHPLGKHWQDGARTLYGIQTHGFPNFLLMSLIQAGGSFNYMTIADEQVRHIAHIVGQCLEHGVETIEPTQEAENAWVTEVIRAAQGRRAFLDACTPGYYNFEGKRSQAVELNDFYCGPPMEYVKRLALWRSRGGFPDMDVTFTNQT
jgi:cyclohexanone monooxygenase